MNALITSTGQIGPFNSITRTEVNDGWLAGDCIYPDGVVGSATIGEWIPPAPASEQVNATTLAAIATLEASVTPRRSREAMLTVGGKVWLITVDQQIADLRKGLVK
jgi:malate synthase